MNRIHKVQELLRSRNIDALIIDKPIDLYYLTGQELSLGRLIVDQTQATLFVDGRYFEACQEQASVSVLLLSEFDKWWSFSEKKVGFDADYTTIASYENLSKLTQQEPIPLKSPIRRIREIKEPVEIDKLRTAAELGSKGFDYVCTLLKEGVTEEEVARELEFFWRRSGGERLAFDPHIAFGEGTSQPHYHTSKRALKKGDTVLIDIGVVVDHYHSDMTRVVFFGEPNPEIKNIYSIVFEAYRSALGLCRPGTKIAALDQAARHVIDREGYKEYFPHSLGHGVGLEIHESPILRSKGVDVDRNLEEGMVITIEPGIYLPGSFGVRLEDTIVITKDRYENMTNRPLSATLPIFS